MGTFSTAEPTNVAGWSEEVSGEIVSMYNQGKYGYAYRKGGAWKNALAKFKAGGIWK